MVFLASVSKTTFMFPLNLLIFEEIVQNSLLCRILDIAQKSHTLCFKRNFPITQFVRGIFCYSNIPLNFCISFFIVYYYTTQIAQSLYLLDLNISIIQFSHCRLSLVLLTMHSILYTLTVNLIPSLFLLLSYLKVLSVFLLNLSTTQCRQSILCCSDYVH